MINGLYKHEVAVKIKEVNGEISGKTIQGNKAPPGVSGGWALLAHPSLPTAFPTQQNSRCGEQLIGLDPTQQ